MDLLLEAFLQRCYPLLSADQQQQFEAFLEETDLDILAWITGREQPDNPAYRAFVQQLRNINDPDNKPGDTGDHV